MNAWLALTLWIAVTGLLAIGLIFQPDWMVKDTGNPSADDQKRRSLRKAGFAVLIIGVGFAVMKTALLIQSLQ